MELTRIVSEAALRQKSSSDDKGINKHRREVYLPLKITTSYLNDKDEIKILKFGYDDENRLISEECITFENGKITEKNIFILYYDTNGALAQYTVKWQEIGIDDEVIYEEENIVNLSYNDLRVTATNNELGNKNILTLNDSGYILKNEHVSEYYSKYDIYHYNKAGNLIKKETANSGSDEEVKKTGYSYDKKTGIFKDLKIEQWVLTLIQNGYENHLVNNMTEVSNCYSSYKEINEYQYRKDNFPGSYTTKRVYESDKDGETEISSTTIEYIKK